MNSPLWRLVGWIAAVVALAVVVQVAGARLGLSTTARIAIFAGVYFAARVGSTWMRRRKLLAQADAVRTELQSTDPEPFVAGVNRRAESAAGSDARKGGIAAAARAIACAVYGDRTRAMAQLEEGGEAAEAVAPFAAARAAIALFCDGDVRAARTAATQAHSRTPGLPRLPAFAVELVDAVYAASLAAANLLPEEATELIRRLLSTSSEPLTRLIASWAAAVMERRAGTGEGKHAEFLREVAPNCLPLQRLDFPGEAAPAD